jgi:acyl-CoA thioesterase-1
MPFRLVRLIAILSIALHCIFTSPVMAADPARILAFGDSLTAGYGLAAEDAFPVQLERALSGAGYRVTIANAGVSGDTTADGRARLAWTLADPYDFAIVEFGANDALRGLDPQQAYGNLDFILNGLAEKKIKVLLAGMYAPRNLGADYAKEFDAIYPRLTAAHAGTLLYPFFLDGVALHPELVQPDGLHPTAAGVAAIVRNILSTVTKLLGPAETLRP